MNGAPALSKILWTLSDVAPSVNLSRTPTEPMQRILSLFQRIVWVKWHRHRRSPPPLAILLQGTSIEMAARRILWSSLRFNDELEELIELTHVLPLLDSSGIDDAQLADTHAVIRELLEIEKQLDDGLTASVSQRLRGIIATLRAQPLWYVRARWGHCSQAVLVVTDLSSGGVVAYLCPPGRSGR